MTITDTTPSTAPTRVRGLVRLRIGQVLLTLLLVMCALVAASTAFSDDPFPGPAIVLISSFGVMAAVFGLALAWSTGRSRLARIVLWALPLFFVWHVAAFGTWIPDAGFAVLAAVGALLVSAGDRRQP